MESLSIFASFALTGSRSPLVSFASQKDTASILHARLRVRHTFKDFVFEICFSAWIMQ